MSYCRWSSDDFKSDVYCYADCSGGYTTHVCNYRHVVTEELPPTVQFDANHREEGMARHKKVLDIIQQSPQEEIGLPYDGKTFNDETPGEAAQTLIMLREAGYYVPQHAIDALLGEEDDRLTNE